MKEIRFKAPGRLVLVNGGQSLDLSELVDARMAVYVLCKHLDLPMKTTFDDMDTTVVTGTLLCTDSPVLRAKDGRLLVLTVIRKKCMAQVVTTVEPYLLPKWGVMVTNRFTNLSSQDELDQLLDGCEVLG